MRNNIFSDKHTTRSERVFLKEDVLKDNCGIFGIYSKKQDVAHLTFLGLQSLQHRGQEGAGIVVSNGKKTKSIRNLGLVTSVFNEENLKTLKGYIAIGHTRYSTTGGNTLNNVQPVILNFKNDDFAVSFNGNIVNSNQLSKTLKRVNFCSTTDTEVIAHIIKETPGNTWEEKISKSFYYLKGAFSISAMSRKKLFAFRDPDGFRPLVLGKINNEYVVCSETCALDTVEAQYIRDIKPGELVTIDDHGLKSTQLISSKKQSFCVFEYVYLSRPDSILNDQLVHQVRQRSGEILSYESPVAADLVVAIPDSGTSAALGYSKASGIPYGEVLIKNRYIGRTFIQPEQITREMGVKMKFNPLKKIIKGKRIIIIDDSIVRGTTIKKIIEILKKCGAEKIHIRVCSPPIKYSCYYGVDTPDRKRLIANKKSVEEIRKYIGADSLKYLSLDGLVQATQLKKNILCHACFTGKYSVPIDNNFRKNIFEK